MTDKIVVLSTCSSKKEAERIARALVESRLAACVNILPRILSVYRWKGDVEESSEWLLLIKTARGNFGRLQAEVRKLHSYEVPELVAVPVVDGLAAYLDWIAASVDSAG
jgi:periplasmic divalent cation tolerance protein